MLLNKFKTLLLLSALSGLFLFLGGLIGGSQGLTFALILALAFNGIVYFFSDTIVLKLYRAQPLDKQHYKSIYDCVDELRRKMDLPMPKLWIIRSDIANAFATGRNPAHASIALTTGIIDLLTQEELRGVLAHELGHVKNRDILISTIAATIATAIGYLASMLRNALFWGSMFGDNRRKSNDNWLGLLVTAILMPIAAALIQMSISRSREYLADETGAECCGEPLALASALQKIEHHARQHHFAANDTVHAATASLFIINPLTKDFFMELFSTHPSTKNRVIKLQQMHSNHSKRYR